MLKQVPNILNKFAARKILSHPVNPYRAVPMQITTHFPPSTFHVKPPGSIDHAPLPPGVLSPLLTTARNAWSALFSGPATDHTIPPKELVS